MLSSEQQAEEVAARAAGSDEGALKKRDIFLDPDAAADAVIAAVGHIWLTRIRDQSKRSTTVPDVLCT